jgi:flagellar hook-associated protein FlgK
MAHKTGSRDRAEIMYKASEYGSTFEITQQFKGGQLGGLLEVRDQIVEDAKKNVDDMAFTMARESG